MSKATRSSYYASYKPNRRVIWLITDGGAPDDGAWYWIEEDDIGRQRGEIHGPFESAVEAGRAARQSILDEAESIDE